MDTLIPASASNPDGCLAVTFIAIAAVAFWLLSRRGPAETLTNRKIEPIQTEKGN